MTAITAQMVKQLREETGAGMMDCKQALAETNGNFDDAVDFLRKKGLKNVSKRAGKVAAEGVVYSYIHSGGRIGVMLEMNCETDFVARGDDFLALAKDVAMHVAWANPQYVRREEVPQNVIEREQEVYKAQLLPNQEKVADKIVSGKLDKFFQSVCLVEQIDARDSSGKKTIGDLATDLSAKIGEKIEIRRFVRFEVGEGIQKEQADFASEVQAVLGA